MRLIRHAGDGIAWLRLRRHAAWWVRKVRAKASERASESGRWLRWWLVTVYRICIHRNVYCTFTPRAHSALSGNRIMLIHILSAGPSRSVLETFASRADRLSLSLSRHGPRTSRFCLRTQPGRYATIPICPVFSLQNVHVVLRDAPIREYLED